MVGREARSINIGISAQERAKLASIKEADGVPKALDMVRHLVHEKTAGMLRRILEEQRRAPPAPVQDALRIADVRLVPRPGRRLASRRPAAHSFFSFPCSSCSSDCARSIAALNIPVASALERPRAAASRTARSNAASKRICVASP